MGLDTMRGSYGRCPPFLVGGLMVVCVILTCNWWSLSSQNYDLIKQLEELGEQLKLSSEERDTCSQQRLSVESRLKNTEEEVAKLRVRFEQQKEEGDEVRKQLSEKEGELNTVNKDKENAESSLTQCQNNLDALKKLDTSKDGIIASLKSDKEKYNVKLNGEAQEVENVRTELEQVRAELKTLKEGRMQAGDMPSSYQLKLPIDTVSPAKVLPRSGVIGMTIGGKKIDNTKGQGLENENDARERLDGETSNVLTLNREEVTAKRSDVSYNSIQSQNTVPVIPGKRDGPKFKTNVIEVPKFKENIELDPGDREILEEEAEQDEEGNDIQNTRNVKKDSVDMLAKKIQEEDNGIDGPRNDIEHV